MSIKQIIKVLLLLAGLALASFIMHQDYYPNTIAYELHGTLKPQDIANVSRQFEKPSFQWEMDLGDKILVMTTGNVQCHKRFSLERPWFYPAKGEAIFSEAVLSDFFRTGRANRQSFRLLDRQWVAAGSVKEGRYVYIGYDADLLALPWNKTTFYYAQKDLQNLEIADQERATFMAAYDINVTNSLYYRDYLLIYYNLALMLLTLSLLRFYKSLRAWLKASAQHFIRHWKASDRYTFKQKLAGFRGPVCRQLLLSVFTCLLALVTLFKLLSQMIPPRTLFPSNWFSPASYAKVIGDFITALNQQLSSGSSDLIFKQGLCLFSLLLWVLLLERLFPKASKIKD